MCSKKFYIYAVQEKSEDIRMHVHPSTITAACHFIRCLSESCRGKVIHMHGVHLCVYMLISDRKISTVHVD